MKARSLLVWQRRDKQTDHRRGNVQRPGLRSRLSCSWLIVSKRKKTGRGEYKFLFKNYWKNSQNLKQESPDWKGPTGWTVEYQPNRSIRVKFRNRGRKGTKETKQVTRWAIGFEISLNLLTATLESGREHLLNAEGKSSGTWNSWSRETTGHAWGPTAQHFGQGTAPNSTSSGLLEGSHRTMASAAWLLISRTPHVLFSILTVPLWNSSPGGRSTQTHYSSRIEGHFICRFVLTFPLHVAEKSPTRGVAQTRVPSEVRPHLRKGRGRLLCLHPALHSKPHVLIGGGPRSLCAPLHGPVHPTRTTENQDHPGFSTPNTVNTPLNVPVFSSLHTLHTFLPSQLPFKLWRWT